MKTCNHCNKSKSLEEFHRDKSKKDGRRYICMACATVQKSKYNKENATQHKARNQKWVKNNPERYKELQLKRKFGLSLEAYKAMLWKQYHSCAICQVQVLDLKKQLAVDHCHKTGKIRGLLCDRCNRGIGFLGENPEVLKRAATYLEKNGE